MKKSTRIAMHLPNRALEIADRLAEKHGTTRSDIIRQAIGILGQMDAVSADGRHIGAAADPAKLDTILLAPIV